MVHARPTHPLWYVDAILLGAILLPFVPPLGAVMIAMALGYGIVTSLWRHGQSVIRWCRQ